MFSLSSVFLSVVELILSSLEDHLVVSRSSCLVGAVIGRTVEVIIILLFGPCVEEDVPFCTMLTSIGVASSQTCLAPL